MLLTTLVTVTANDDDDDGPGDGKGRKVEMKCCSAADDSCC